MEIDNKAVGNRIKSIRKQKGLTTKDFGKFISGASDSLVSRWERGVNLPNNARLKMIAKFGEITVEELLYGDFRAFCYSLFDSCFNEMSIAEGSIFRYYFPQIDKPKLFESVFEKVSKRNLDYTDSEEIKKIFNDEFTDLVNYYFYSDEEAIAKVLGNLKSYLGRDLYHYFYKDGTIKVIGGKDLEPSGGTLRENLTEKAYSQCKEVLEKAIKEIEVIKETYKEKE